MFGHADQCKQVFYKDGLETFHCTCMLVLMYLDVLCFSKLNFACRIYNFCFRMYRYALYT